MNRTGDQTCFLFSCRDRDSVSNFAQAYSEAIQDKEKILSILRINPGATRGGLSQRGHRLPAWVRRHLEAELHGMTKESASRCRRTQAGNRCPRCERPPRVAPGLIRNIESIFSLS